MVGETLKDSAAGVFGVVAGGDLAACRLDGCDGFCGCTRNENVDWCLQLLLSPCQKLDAVLNSVQTPRVGQLLHGNWLCWVQSALVDPLLNAVQIDWRHLDGEALRKLAYDFHLPVLPIFLLRDSMGHILVVRSLMAVHNILRRLTTLESRRNFSMLFLTLVSSSRCLSFSTGWTTSATNALLVGLVSVVQASKNGGVADGEGWEEEGGHGAIVGSRWAKSRSEGRYPRRHGGG